jgi:signal transduction histidine kinase
VAKDQLTISVNDRGIGIPKANQHRVFEKFFRGDNAVRMETEGSGLGLYICQLIVEASGGKIWFESDENKGSKFSFTLPLAGSKAYKGETSLA